MDNYPVSISDGYKAWRMRYKWEADGKYHHTTWLATPEMLVSARRASYNGGFIIEKPFIYYGVRRDG